MLPTQHVETLYHRVSYVQLGTQILRESVIFDASKFKFDGVFQDEVDRNKGLEQRSRNHFNMPTTTVGKQRESKVAGTDLRET